MRGTRWARPSAETEAADWFAFFGRVAQQLEDRLDDPLPHRLTIHVSARQELIMTLSSDNGSIATMPFDEQIGGALLDVNFRDHTTG